MEAKVSFHVRRYLRECEERGAHPSEATVTSHLRETYAEYQRKPQGALRKVVAKVLKKAQPEAPKRSRSESDSDNETEIRAAEQQQATSQGNSLNRAMQQNYAGQNNAEKPLVKKVKILRKRVKKDITEEGNSGTDETKGFVVERPTTRYSDVGGIQAILQERETSARGMEKRIVAQLLTSTDSLSLANTGGKPVVLIGATNRPDALDSALRRAGRFDREICLGIPDEEAREKILRVLARKMTLEGDFDFAALARRTPGYVGADLVSLTKEAAVGAVNRIFTNINTERTVKSEGDAASVSAETETSDAVTSEDAMEVDATYDNPAETTKDAEETPSAADDLRAQVEPFTEAQLAPLSITMADFEAAIPKVQPSSKREGFATIPDVTWDDIGALTEVRDELSLAILQPIAHPERFAALGLSMPAGVLLYGPPGCGKTLLAKAIAHESGANFISIKGPELLDKYVGESERSVRQVFQRARASSPCVVFFDELDALAPRRSGGAGGDSGGNGVSERVVNQLLTEMDGLDGRRNVFVIAATNRPDIIDPAMLRPGRLDKLLYVPLPRASERHQILKTISAKCAMAPSVQLASIAADPRCEGFSGADLSALVREAGITALRETDFSKLEAGATVTLGIEHHHFISAFDRVFPSVSRADQRMFDRMKKNLRKSRSVMTRSSSSTAVASVAGAEAEPTAGNGDEAGAKADVDKQ
ncbi:hypothetical protein PRNP1_001332 [Phytophthora ramorum]